MITQFGNSGISLIFDKSLFHSLSFEEILLLHKYYWVNITPILVMEVLGDLKKQTEDGGLNSKKVTEFANKLYPFNSSINAFYLNLIHAELLGELNIPFYKPIVDTAEPVEMSDGKMGYKINSSDDRINIDRWKEGIFLETDIRLSQTWRETTLQPDILTKIKKDFITNVSFFKGLKKQEDILQIFDSLLDKPNFQLTFLELFIEEFSIPPEKAGQIFYRWEITNNKNLRLFAPYALFCLRANFLFYISLQNDIINTRPTNWLDLHYTYYLPFCRIFLSNDKFHDEIVPYLINNDQRYIKGSEMKNDLKKIIEIKKQLVGKDLIRAEREPPRNPELLTYQIWNQMYTGWPPQTDWEPSEEEMKIMNDLISQFRNAKPII